MGLTISSVLETLSTGVLEGAEYISPDTADACTNSPRDGPAESALEATCSLDGTTTQGLDSFTVLLQTLIYPSRRQNGETSASSY